MEIGTLVAVLSLVAAVGAPAVVFGVMRRKVEECGERNAEQEARIDKCAAREEVRSLEERVREDRERNFGAHKEIYSQLSRHEATIGEIKTMLIHMQRSLDEVKRSVEKGFDKLEREVKSAGGEIGLGARSKAELLGLTERILELYVKERLTVEQIARRLREEEHDIGREAVRGALNKAKGQLARQEERLQAARLIIESSGESGGADAIDAALQLVAGFGFDMMLSMRDAEEADAGALARIAPMLARLAPMLARIGESQARIMSARMTFQNGFESARKAVLASLKEELKGRPELLEKLREVVASLDPAKGKR
jgi:hypothetical protein